MRLFRSVVACVVLLAACDSTSPGGERYLAALTSAAETDPLESIAGGTATVTFAGGSMAYTVTLQGITGVTAVHLHSGAQGVDGPALVTLFGGPTTGAFTGTLVSGTVSAANLTAVSMDSLAALTRAANTYVNVYTLSRPTGEIRGQLFRQ